MKIFVSWRDPATKLLNRVRFTVTVNATLEGRLEGRLWKISPTSKIQILDNGFERTTLHKNKNRITSTVFIDSENTMFEIHYSLKTYFKEIYHAQDVIIEVTEL